MSVIFACRMMAKKIEACVMQMLKLETVGQEENEIRNAEDELRMIRVTLGMMAEADLRDTLPYIIDAFERLEAKVVKKCEKEDETAALEIELSKIRKNMGIDKMAMEIRMDIKRTYFYQNNYLSNTYLDKKKEGNHGTHTVDSAYRKPFCECSYENNQG